MNNEHLIKTCSYAIDESVFFKSVCSNKSIWRGPMSGS